jgi:hypothetical protein
VTRAQETVDDVRANEPGPARDENTHVEILTIRAYAAASSRSA